MLVNAVNQNGPYESQFCALQGARLQLSRRLTERVREATKPEYVKGQPIPLILNRLTTH